MSDPVELQIVDEIKTRLDRISIANGYAFDAAGVREPNRLGSNASPRPHAFDVVIVSVSENEAFDHEGNPPAVGRTVEVLVYANESHVDGSTSGRDRDALAMIAAARRAITNPAASPSTWYTMGGLAVDTEFGEAGRVQAGDATPTGWSLPIMVNFRVDETDPTNPRS